MGFSLSVGAVVLKNHQILLVKHNYGPTKGKWDFVRGYVEANKSIEQAVEREVYEEAKVESSAQRIIAVRKHVAEKRNDLLTIWEMKYLSGNPEPGGREISETKFFELSEIEQCVEINNWAKEVILKINKSSGLVRSPYVPNSSNADIAWNFYTFLTPWLKKMSRKRSRTSNISQATIWSSSAVLG